MKRYGVRPSVCLSHLSTAAAAACGGFAAERPAGRIYRWTAGVGRRSAANAGSVAFTAAVDRLVRVVHRAGFKCVEAMGIGLQCFDAVGWAAGRASDWFYLSGIGPPG